MKPYLSITDELQAIVDNLDFAIASHSTSPRMLVDELFESELKVISKRLSAGIERVKNSDTLTNDLFKNQMEFLAKDGIKRPNEEWEKDLIKRITPVVEDVKE